MRNKKHRKEEFPKSTLWFEKAPGQNIRPPSHGLQVFNGCLLLLKSSILPWLPGNESKYVLGWDTWTGLSRYMPYAYENPKVYTWESVP